MTGVQAPTGHHHRPRRVLTLSVARSYGVSQSWISRLMARYAIEGPAAFEPRWHRPHSSPHATDAATTELVLRIRKELSQAGLDAGADTIG